MITLATLEAATAQQVFDQVVAHLRKQGERSYAPLKGNELARRCAYRGEGGLKCAAGCFIADDEYDPEMENIQWRSLADGVLTPGDHRLIKVPRAHDDLIRSLQVIHDHSKPEDWENRLAMLALKEGLYIDKVSATQ